MARIDGRDDRNDTLNDTLDSDEIYGFGGNDTIRVTAGNDSVFGGAGRDTLVINYADAPNSVYTNGRPGANGADGGFDGQYYVYASGRSVSFSSIERFDITTGASGDSIVTATGDDVVRLNAGNDFVDVGTGNDTADGGADVDGISADLSALGTAVRWDLVQNTFSGTGRSFTNFEFFGTVTTGGGNDVIVSTTYAYSETFNTGGGDDAVTVYAGNDTVNAGAGTDTLVVDYSAAANSVYSNGRPGANTTDGGLDGQFYIYASGVSVTFSSVERFTITTGAFGDSIVTGNGDDVVKLGASNDFVDIGAGNDVADGGTEIDGISADLSALGTAVRWDLQKNTFSGAGHSFTNFEYFGTVATGGGNDVLVSTAYVYSEIFNTGDGNDSVTVVAGNDTVNAGKGLDTLVIDYSAAANSVLVNGRSANTTDGGFDGAFYVYANSTSVGYTSIERFDITGGASGDSISTATGNDVVKSGSGNDFVDVGSGNDTADGGGDIDGISADLSAMTTAVNWNLAVNTFSGTGRSFTNFEYFGTVATGSGNDTVVSGTTNSAETVNSGGGDDAVSVFNGNDTVNAAAGRDTLVIDYSTAANEVRNGGGPAINATDGGYDGNFNVYANPTSVTYTSIERFDITTGVYNDIITTAAGDDVVRTGDGDDVVDVGSGTDFADGGVGKDGISANLTDAAGAINWNLKTNSYSGGPDTFVNFEWFGTVATGGGNDVITTGLTGRSEAIDAGLGDDTVSVSDGNDTVTGGGGLDTLVVDYASAANEVRNGGGPTANAAGGFDGNFNVYANPASVTYSSIERFVVTTGAYNDSILTATGDDVVSTAAGNDTVDVGAGNDTADGGADFDRISADLSALTTAVLWDLGANQFAGAGRSFTNFEVFGTVVTGSGNDTIVSGRGGSETISTNGGDDRVTVFDGYDTVYGGSGIDTLVVDYSTATNEVRNNGGPNLNTAEGGYDGNFNMYAVATNVSYTSIERFEITTGAFNDTITTAVGNDIIRTGSGNDYADGGAGDDLIEGGDSNDTLIGGDGIDTVTYATAAAAVTVNLGLTTQQDTIGAGADILIGFENLTGSAFADSLTGSDGANLIDGGIGGDVMAGGLGDDTYAVDDAGDTVTELAGGGTDTVRSSISYALGAEVENLLLTGTGAINGTGNGLANAITGNDRANTLDGGAGADTMAGLGGDDTYVVDDAGDTVAEAADAGTDLVRAAVSFTLGSNVENLTLAGAGAIDGTGNELVNILTGNEGANTLDGKAGADRLIGHGGSDTYVVDEAGDVVIEAADAGTDLVHSAVSYTLTANVENLTLTGAALINATGNGLANVLTGNDAANTLDGAGGVDTMVGGAGDDTYLVDATGETVTELAGGGTDLVRSSATFTLSANVENLILTGSGNTGGTGNAGANVITGNGGNNTIEGAGGDDTLDGGVGFDTASYASAASGVTVSLAKTGAQATGGAGTDTLANFEALLGSAFADTLTGNAGANTLSGSGGNDTLTGGGGADQLVGGAGTDTAVFSGRFVDYDVTVAGGVYTVTDRRAGADGTDTLTTIERVTLSTGTYATADVVNQGPTGVDDTAVGVVEARRDDPGTPGASGNVLANDLDPNLAVAGLGETLTVTGARSGTTGSFTAVASATVLNGRYGTLTINADGSYSYVLDNTRAATDQLAPGQTAQDVFVYTLADAHGAASQATLTIAVTGSDDTVAGADTLQVTAGRTSALDLAVLLGNDSGALGETLTIVSVGNATGGTVAIVDGKLAITASAGSGGFDYVVQTSGGGTATGHVDFTAIPAPRKIVATAPAGVTAVDYVGGSLGDQLTGSAGDDRLVGNGGLDRLDGGTGADRMEGGAASDTYYVDNAGDLVVEAGFGRDTVITTLSSYTLTADVEQLFFAGTGAFAGTGNAARNVITGGAGNDTLSGGDGVDLLLGGLGDDRLDGGNGLDTARYTGAVGGVTIDLRLTGAQDTRGAGFDTLVAIENVSGSAGVDVLNGSDGANVLTGGGSKDTLYGNGGNDTLIGGVAGDTLWGGRAADTFAYLEVGDFNGDRIADFSSAQNDKIDVSAIDLDPVTAGQQGFTFIGTAAFSGAAGTGYELRYQASATAGDLTVQGDINHDGVADFAFTVTAASLAASDFILMGV